MRNRTRPSCVLRLHVFETHRPIQVLRPHDMQRRMYNAHRLLGSEAFFDQATKP